MTLETYYLYIYGLYLIIIAFCKRMGGLRFPPHIWGLEFSATLVFLLMQAQRIDLGNRANRNEHHRAMLIFMIFSVFVILFYLYFSLFTTYVLVVDIVFGSLGVLISSLEFVLSVYAYLTFKKNPKI